MSKTLKKSLSILLALTMLFSIMVTFATAEPEPPANSGVSFADFSGRLGQWGEVDYDSFSTRDPLMGIKAFQQDEFLYISVEAEAGGFGPNPTVYIDNGSAGVKAQELAWRALGGYLINNRISHKIEDGKLFAWVSGGAVATADWVEVANSGMIMAAGGTSFVEYRIPVAALGVTGRNIMRVGYFNGLNFYRPVAGLPMLVVDAPMQDLNPENMPVINVHAHPNQWLDQGLLPIAHGDRRTSGTTSDMFGGDLYGFRDGDWVYLLLLGKDSHTGRNFDTRVRAGEPMDGETCIVLNTDGDPNTGYSPSFTTMYAAAGADFEIKGPTAGMSLSTGYDWAELGSLLDDPAAYGTDPWAYKHDNPNEAYQRVYFTEDFSKFYEGDANAPYFQRAVQIKFNIAEIQKRASEAAEEDVWMAEIIKVGVFIDGSAYMPATSHQPTNTVTTAYVPLPNGLRYNFTMTGNKADWASVETASYSEPADYILHANTDGGILYTMVSGFAMNTQNVYFISTGETGGFTRHGRPNIHYIVANGKVYRTTGNNSSATPEWVQNATEVGHISMEYWRDNTMMQLRLDQIGNPDPTNIAISYFGKNAVNLPVNTGELLPVKSSFDRLREDGVFYPVESYDRLFNPLMGQAPSMAQGGPANNVRMAYAYMSWRDFEPEKGVYNFDGVRVWNNNYPHSTGTLFSTALAAYQREGAYLNLRFIMNYPGGGASEEGRPGAIDIPVWLYEELVATCVNHSEANCLIPNQGDCAAGRFYNASGVGRGFSPNYNHPLVIEYHEKLIQALAAEIAKENSVWNSVANMQIGSLGHWGEFHNWPEADTGRFPNLSVSEQYVKHYIEAFADNDNIQIAMRYPTPIAAQNNLGLFNDLMGQLSDTQTWVNWFTIGRPSVHEYDDSGRSLEQFVQDMINPNFWKYSFSGGEYGNNGTGAANDGQVMDALEGNRISHTTSMGPRGPNPNQTFNNAANQILRKNVDAIYDNMGYKFVIEEFAMSDTVTVGKTTNVSMTVYNKGVAPFYRQWPVEISFIDGEGATAFRTVTDVDITKWMPRHTCYDGSCVGGNKGAHFDGRNSVEFSLNVPADLSPGDYTVAIAIIYPVSGNPGIDFAITGRTADGRYRLNDVTAVDVPSVALTAARPAQLIEHLAEYDRVFVNVPGNLGIFAQHSPFTVPAGKELVVVNVLNIHGSINVEGTLIVAAGGRINNQKGGTINIAEGGVLINNGHVENVTGSFVVNAGTITNNDRFEVRAGTTLDNSGIIDGEAALRIHRDAIIPTPPEPEEE